MRVPRLACHIVPTGDIDVSVGQEHREGLVGESDFQCRSLARVLIGRGSQSVLCILAPRERAQGWCCKSTWASWPEFREKYFSNIWPVVFLAYFLLKLWWLLRLVIGT